MAIQLPILVVDDQAPMRQAIVSVLREMGYGLTQEADCADAAMQQLRAGGIHAVISDWNMPGMSGLELLRWVRGEPRYLHLPFMLVAAETSRETIRLAFEAGASDYLIKPFTANNLKERVRRLLGADAPVVAPCPAVPVASPRVIGEMESMAALSRMKASSVLIVDDVPTNIEVMTGLLKAEYTIKVAVSGARALEIARSTTPPDLILLDVMMPDMDGFEVCRQLKADPTTRDIPVIFLSARDAGDDVAAGLELGAVDYVTKPVNPVVLRARLRTHLKLRNAFADLERRNRALVESAALRDDVERITAYDLKSPLAAILQHGEMLLGAPDLQSWQQQSAQAIVRAARLGLDRVSQSMDLFKLETGRFKLDVRAVSLPDLLNDVVGDVLAVSGRQVPIRLELPKGVDAADFRVGAERGLCLALFGNLLRNAIEASADGEDVKLVLSRQATQVLVEIRNAQGLPDAMRSQLFEKYASHGKPGALGLGAYAARLFALAMGGGVELLADPAGGTRLLVSLPAQS
ncbi:response regulator [Parachitinimonas caeni]|uniref:Response regulator n=1 Tax=Parachitinimonas caeni TaxID=3031301 RepID=A0ABT7DXB7_9NEIS|nr:response regulator [Parachitinimonas caeni]MDK2124714.1 response regulator [Parachitinimonas caeni]